MAHKISEMMLVQEDEHLSECSRAKPKEDTMCIRWRGGRCKYILVCRLEQHSRICPWN